MLETLDFTIRNGSTPTVLYFDMLAKSYTQAYHFKLLPFSRALDRKDLLWASFPGGAYLPGPARQCRN